MGEGEVGGGGGRWVGRGRPGVGWWEYIYHIFLPHRCRYILPSSVALIALGDLNTHKSHLCALLST